MSNHDPVKNPAHYDLFPGQQAIDIIRAALTPEEFVGYCKGNALKYRLRAGSKGDAAEDLAKAEKYRSWISQLAPVQRLVTGSSLASGSRGVILYCGNQLCANLVELGEPLCSVCKKMPEYAYPVPPVAPTYDCHD